MKEILPKETKIVGIFIQSPTISHIKNIILRTNKCYLMKLYVENCF